LSGECGGSSINSPMSRLKADFSTTWI
jgi:hypothetical protein